MNEQQWLTSTHPAKMLQTIYGRFGNSGAGFESSERLRLFACACCRRVWDLLDDPHRQAVQALENYAWAPKPGGLGPIRRLYRPAAQQLAQEWAEQCDTHWRPANIISYFTKGGLPWSRMGLQGESNHPTRFARLEVTTRCRAASVVWKTAENKPTTAVRSHINAGLARAYHEFVEQVRQQAEEETFSLRVNELVVSTDEMALQANLLRDVVGNPWNPVTLDLSGRVGKESAAFRLAQAIDQEQTWADLPVLADALEEAGCTNNTILDHCRTPGAHTRGCWVVDLLQGRV